MYFDDNRTLTYPPVDRLWSTAAEAGWKQRRRVQAREVRGIVWNGLAWGLRNVTGAKILSPEEFKRDPRTHIAISGSITQCMAGAFLSDYWAKTELEVNVLDKWGNTINKLPIIVSGDYKKKIHKKGSASGKSERSRNDLAPSVEESIEAALEELLSSSPFREALLSAY